MRRRIAPFLALLIMSLANDLSAQNAVEKDKTANTYTGDFQFETRDGPRIVPLPKGVWHKVLDIRTERKGQFTSGYPTSWDIENLVLAQVSSDRVTGIIAIITNYSVMPGKGIEPSDFCNTKQPNWIWHKTVSALTSDTFCWGVTYMRLRKQPLRGIWSSLTEKFSKLGWISPSGSLLTAVAFVRSDNESFLDVRYMFIGNENSVTMHWEKARDWAESVIPGIIAGLKGKRAGGSK